MLDRSLDGELDSVVTVVVDDGRPVGAFQAYRMAFSSLAPVLGAVVIAVVIVSLLTSSVFLIPVAIWLAVRWALVAPVVTLESVGSVAALRRSSRLVRGDWLKVGSLTIVSAAVALVLGPLIGTVLIVLTVLLTAVAPLAISSVPDSMITSGLTRQISSSSLIGHAASGVKG